MWQSECWVCFLWDCENIITCLVTDLVAQVAVWQTLSMNNNNLLQWTVKYSDIVVLRCYWSFSVQTLHFNFNRNKNNWYETENKYFKSSGIKYPLLASATAQGEGNWFLKSALQLAEREETIAGCMDNDISQYALQLEFNCKSDCCIFKSYVGTRGGQDSLNLVVWEGVTYPA